METVESVEARLCTAVAATFALMQGSESNAQYFDVYLTINFLSLPTGYIGMALFMVFVLASDMSEKMRLQSITDTLTGCLNRRGFYQNAAKKLTQFIRLKQHVCFIYWDIDKFKQVNDTYGHTVGDVVLKRTTSIVRDNIKDKDLLGRLGGEEFVILLGRASAKEAQSVAERLREKIEGNLIECQGENLKVTASFGVVEVTHPETEVEKVIDCADKALYQAKENGRNQVVEAFL